MNIGDFSYRELRVLWLYWHKASYCLLPDNVCWRIIHQRWKAARRAK
jgi:hypothetical protein